MRIAVWIVMIAGSAAASILCARQRTMDDTVLAVLWSFCVFVAGFMIGNGEWVKP